MKLYITQCCLTEGISEVEAEIDPAYPDMVKISNRQWDWYCHGKGKNWHETRDEAVRRATEMRAKKIVQLKKKIARIEQLNFN